MNYENKSLEQKDSIKQLSDACICIIYEANDIEDQNRIVSIIRETIAKHRGDKAMELEKELEYVRQSISRI